MENLGKRGTIIYEALKDVNPAVKMEVLSEDGFKAMYLNIGDNCQPVIEMGDDWYKFMDCNGQILSESSKFKKPKHVKKEVFAIKRALTSLDGALQASVENQLLKEHPLLRKLIGKYREIFIEDGNACCYEGNYKITAVSPSIVKIEGSDLSEEGVVISELTPFNVKHRLKRYV